jgi:hypothetical protein
MIFCTKFLYHLQYLLFLGYLLLFSWLVTRVRFFKRTGLTAPQLIIIFLFKVLAGIFYGWIGRYYGNLAQMQDTWGYHINSLQEYQLLLNDPGAYFTNLFYNPYEGSFMKFFTSQDSYWSDIKGNFFIKVLSVFNIASFGSYYVNVIIYAFVSLFGAVAIFRVMDHAFPGRRTPLVLAVFFIPSFLYWCSGIHKEGLIFLGIAIAVYHVYFASVEKKVTFKRVLWIFLGLFLMMILRNFLIVLLLPALMAWLLSIKWPRYTVPVYSFIYFVSILAFFNLRKINPAYDFPQAVVNKQQEFLKLAPGGSTIPIKRLEPTAISFLKNTPQAITLSAIRPYPGDIRHLLSLAAATEIVILLFLVTLFLLFRTPITASKGFMWFCIFFSAAVLLSIGFSVNNLGAIVRYRSIVLPFLIIPVVTCTDWKRFIRVIGPKSSNQV